MKKTLLTVLACASVLSAAVVIAQTQNSKPTTATYIMKEEIDAISATEQPKSTQDENAKVVDLGYENFSLGVIHRGSTRTPPPAPAGRGNANASATPPEPCGRHMAYTSSWRNTGRHHSRLPDRRLLHRLWRRNDVHRRLHCQRTAQRPGRSGRTERADVWRNGV